MKWIKASDRMPERAGVENSVLVKLNNRTWGGYAFKNHDPGNPQFYIVDGGESFLTKDCEWLDESPETPPHPPVSVEEAAKKWADNNQNVYIRLGSHTAVQMAFLAGSRYQSELPTPTVDIVEALEKAAPSTDSQNSLSDEFYKGYCNALAKLRELIAAQPPAPSVGVLLNEFGKFLSINGWKPYKENQWETGEDDLASTFGLVNEFLQSETITNGAVQGEQKEIGKHCSEIREMADTLPPEQFVHWFNQQYTLIKKQ